uniref:CBM20 domain-containing protein n=2 Tax=Physcomitrium patens TaxID=3218 RepID=A0A7I4CM91_PHYPA
MMIMAAIAGPHRAGLLAYTGNGVEAENYFNGIRLVQTVKVGSSVQDRVLRQRCNLIRLAGLSGSCVQSARQWFRVTAFSEDGLAIDRALEAVDESSGVTMKVKFQLQRECQFGQQFKVVGSGSHFGDWDPSAALPLNWSEGHLWTTEVDIPKDRKFEWKYILVSTEGEETEWQSGPNHVLETVPGASSLLVSIPWERIPHSADSTSDQFQEVQRCEHLEGQDTASDTEDLDAIGKDSKVNTSVEKLTEAAASAAGDVLKAGIKAATIVAASLDATPVEEHADGSLLFSFSGSTTTADAAAQPTIQQIESANVNVPTQTLTPAALPQRHPSSFQKKSPIPAARSRRTASKAEADTAELVAAEDKETPVDSTVSSISARPERHASSFSRKSPIPKNRERSSVSSSKRQSSAEATPVAKAPSKSKFTTRSPISRNQNSSRATRSEKKKSHSSEVAPAELVSPSKTASADTEVAESEALEHGAVSKDLSSYKLSELRSMAKAKGLKGYSKLKKGELVKLIAASDVSSEI